MLSFLEIKVQNVYHDKNNILKGFGHIIFV